MSARRGELRVIAGVWRSRRIRFPDSPGLRPTPDRLRETLFNWLDPWIEGRCVLDLYAGSGALGIEALSRGAREVVFVERSRRAAAALRENLAHLDAVGAQVECTDALQFLRGDRRTFDLVFLDPPWASELVTPSLAALVKGGRLEDDHRVYVETSRMATRAPLPAGWTALATSRVGDVNGRLFVRSAGEGAGLATPVGSG